MIPPPLFDTDFTSTPIKSFYTSMDLCWSSRRGISACGAVWGRDWALIVIFSAFFTSYSAQSSVWRRFRTTTDGDDTRPTSRALQFVYKAALRAIIALHCRSFCQFSKSKSNGVQI
jgi:hypothetical protein